MKTGFNNILSDTTNIAPRNIKIPFLCYEENNSNQNGTENNNEVEDIPVFDLNKIFQFNFSYNFDILKSLLETLIRNQQEYQREIIKMKKDNEIKINEIESNIVDMRIALSSPQFLEELKKEKEKLKIESEIIKNKIIKEKNLEKIQNENNRQLINELTVSTITIQF
jgi:hypothetical protein